MVKEILIAIMINEKKDLVMFSDNKENIDTNSTFFSDNKKVH